MAKNIIIENEGPIKKKKAKAAIEISLNDFMHRRYKYNNEEGYMGLTKKPKREMSRIYGETYSEYITKGNSVYAFDTKRGKYERGIVTDIEFDVCGNGDGNFYKVVFNSTKESIWTNKVNLAIKIT